jgi:SAM-dependent methyltransferase
MAAGTRLRRLLRRSPVAMRLGQIASTAPLSDQFGFDRGTPIDRYYIERFLRANADDVHGRVLEIGDSSYSQAFGSNRVTQQDILHVHAGHSGATIVGDLCDSETLPTAAFDCIILTQTLHLIFDMALAISQLHRALRPGGVLLLTVPGITPVDRGEWKTSWYWSLTGAALSRLLSGPFAPTHVEVTTYGNLFAATAFLHGAAVEEVSLRKLDKLDDTYPVIAAARIKA